MLRTRLWMGTVLVLLVVGMLVVDRWLAPWFPFLFVFVVGLAMVACFELLRLLGSRGPHPWLCYTAVAALLTCNWLPRLPVLEDIGVLPPADPWALLFGVFAVVVLA